MSAKQKKFKKKAAKSLTLKNGLGEKKIASLTNLIKKEVDRANQQLVDTSKYKISKHRVCRHTRTIYDFTLHPTKSCLLTASRDHTARLWDVISGVCLRVYRGHTDYVSRIFVDDSGSFALTISRDKTAKRWSIDTGKCIQTYVAGPGLYSGDLCTNSKIVATGNEQGMVTIWGWEGNKLNSFKAHKGKVRAVALSGNGEYLFTAGEDGLAKLWKIGEKKFIKKFRHHANQSVNDLCVSKDGRVFYTAGDDGLIKRWDIGSKKPSNVYKGHIKPLTRINLNKRENELVSVSKDDTVKRWRCDQANCLTTHYYGWSYAFGSVAVVDSGKSLLINRPSGLYLLEAETGKCLKAIPTKKQVHKVAWSQTTGLCAFRQGDNRLIVWCRDQDKIIATFDFEHQTPDICFHPTERSFVTASWDGTARVWDIEKQENTLILRHFEKRTKEYSVDAAAFVANGDYVATGCRGLENNLRL